MAFKYACFISYCHGQGELMTRFIEQLRRALHAHLEPYFNEGLYIDEERLKPGYQFNEALAKAICESLCMVVVYVPKYERQSYCLREFAAMAALQEERFRRMGPNASRQHGMIIPVILRGGGDPKELNKILPPQITGSSHYVDFSKYSTATRDILTSHALSQQVDQIARAIYELAKEIKKSGVEVCQGCEQFRLPEDVPPWREVAEAPFPRA